MFEVWQEVGFFKSTEQRMCDQARLIPINVWLSKMELEVLKRGIKGRQREKSDAEQEDEEEGGGREAANQRTFGHEQWPTPLVIQRFKICLSLSSSHSNIKN